MRISQTAVSWLRPDRSLAWRSASSNPLYSRVCSVLLPIRYHLFLGAAGEGKLIICQIGRLSGTTGECQPRPFDAPVRAFLKAFSRIFDARLGHFCNLVSKINSLGQIHCRK